MKILGTYLLNCISTLTCVGCKVSITLYLNCRTRKLPRNEYDVVYDHNDFLDFDTDFIIVSSDDQEDDRY